MVTKLLAAAEWQKLYTFIFLTGHSTSPVMGDMILRYGLQPQPKSVTHLAINVHDNKTASA
jgi:hypothetical protein